MAYRGHHYRGNRGGRHSFGRSQTMPLPPLSPSQNLLTKLTVASISSDIAAVAESKIESVEQVASFNWKEATSPTILVPGKPPKWQPLATPHTLHEDGGLYYRDPNSARYPSYPTEPAIRAIRTLNADFDLSSVDIFGCGNTIGSLLSFARDEERTFRFGVELIGSSVILVRKTNELGELIEDVYGYGHTFPEAYTTWDKSVKGSASHQRIIKYDFAGLKCLVRSESDGYLPELVGEEYNGENTENANDADVSKLDTGHMLSLALGLKPTAPSESDRLIIEHTSVAVPQQAVFDLKTRSIKRKHQDGVSVVEFLPRLWVNQTSNMIMAYHSRGKFEKQDIHVINTKDQVLEWESRNTVLLSKFGSLLHKLIDVAKKTGPRFEVRRTGRGPLELWSELSGWSALPDDLKSLWGMSEQASTTMSIGAVASPSRSGEAMHADKGKSGDEEEEDYLRF